MTFDDFDIDRILEHVGRDFVPDTLDELELRKDIVAAWDFYQGYENTIAKGARTRRRNYADKVSRQTRALVKLITDPSSDATLVRRRINQNLSADDAEQFFVSLTNGLKELALEARAAVKKYDDPDTMREILEVSPTDWLLGEGLVRVFETHFRRPVTRTREAGGPPKGPFIRFATAVTAQLGEPFSDETVSKAISALRKRPGSLA